MNSMKRSRIAFHLRASAATFALLCAVGAHEAYALPSTLPENCTFIYPDGWRCCWNDGTCSELFPEATEAPTPTPTVTATPVPTVKPPAATTAPEPTPTTTACPTSWRSSVPGIGVPGMPHGLVGTGLFTTSHDTAALECGKEDGKVTPCPPRKIGNITKNCVLTGFDPPPMLRSNVAANIKFGDTAIPMPDRLIPFVALPTAGVTVLAAGAVMNTLSASCLTPYKIDTATGNMIRDNDPSISSPNKCPVKQAVAGLAPNSPTRPAPTPCPVPGPATCKDADAPPDPAGTVYACDTPDSADGPVPNLPTGCTTTTVSGYPIPYSYCHKNLSAIPQRGPVATDEAIPGMACGGAIPLLNPVPWTDAEAMPQCPPDDWCIKPATSGLFRDGSLHINQGAPAGVYNITLSMGQNNLYVGTTSRIYTLPSMGLCKEYFPAAVGSLVLSEGYSYLISPSSVRRLTSAGWSYCYGWWDGFSSCDYTPATFEVADYPIDYTTNPYRPYGAISTVAEQTYPTLPVSTIPFINLSTGTQVYFSLSVPGSIRLPEGGSFVSPTGGIVTIPKNGWIASQGDGTTVRLGPGVGYLLDAGTMKVAGATCFVQLIPPMTGEQVVNCVGVPPPPAVMSASVPNVAIPILTSAINVPKDTPLPPFTEMEYDNNCPPPAKITLEGLLIEPSWCITPTVLNPLTGLCITPTVTCPGGTVIPYSGPVPPPASGGVKCETTSTTGCTAYLDDGFTCAYTITTLANPTLCDPPGFIWCHNTQTCTYGVEGSAVSAMCAP